MYRVHWPLLFLIAAVMGAACNLFQQNSPTNPSGTSVTSVSVTGSNAVSVGATVIMTATATESDGSTQDVTTSATWQSSNPPVATVSSSGQVKGVAPGTSTISASYQSMTGQLSVTVAGSTGAPAAVSVPAVTGTAAAGQTLSASPGVWNGSTPLTFTYQWLRCDAAGNSCSNIAGATAPTFVLGGTDVGHTLRVVVTATNSLGAATATSLPTSVVQ